MEIFRHFSISQRKQNLRTETFDRTARRVESALLDSDWIAFSGRIGSGKTTTVYDSLREAGKNHIIEVVEISAPDRRGIKVQHILDSFVYTLGKKYDGDGSARRQLSARTVQVERILMQVKRRGAIPVLVIDEAQELRDITFNIIKRLRDVTFIKQAVMLPVILIGQENLGTLLKRNDEVTDRVTNFEFGYSKGELIKIAEYHAHGLLNEQECRFLVNAFTTTHGVKKILPTPLKLERAIYRALGKAYSIDSETLQLKHFDFPDKVTSIPKIERKKIEIKGMEALDVAANIEGRTA
jgi:type II secretory pathway predicted ATPase ExeA